MRKSVLGATLVALLGGTALVSAQQGTAPGSGADQPSMKEQSPGTNTGGSDRGAQRAPDAGGKGGDQGTQRAQGPGSDKGGAGAKSDSDRPARTEKSDQQDRKGTAQSGDRGKAGTAEKDKAGDMKSKTAEPKDKASDTKSKTAEPKDKAGDTKGKTAEPKDKADDTKGKTAEPKDKAGDKGKTAEPKDKAGDTKGKMAEPKDKAGDKGKTAEPKDKAGDRTKDRTQGRDQQQRDQAQTRDGRDGARVTLSQDQRTRIHQSLSTHREARVNRVNFSVSVGTRVPRDVPLRALPADIVSIVPAYRSYRYVIVEDRIVIVQPRTYEIVEVIDVSGGPARGRPTMASLSLSQQQITFIVEHIPADRGRADVRVDLALGAEVPSSVELYEFPSEIISEVPEVRPYRYVVVDRKVVIIDPSKRGVVQVLDR